MNNPKEQAKIIKKNQEIVDAVLIVKMMECDGFKVFKKHLKDFEKSIRFQDVLGIKDDALPDQKGIALGIIQIQNYFKTMQKKSEQPRLDPGTGKPEFIKKDK